MDGAAMIHTKYKDSTLLYERQQQYAGQVRIIDKYSAAFGTASVPRMGWQCSFSERNARSVVPSAT